MLQSKLFPKTSRSAPKDAESINHKYLVRGGFIDQLMSGSWTLLPLGYRVVDKINKIIREEIDKTGAQEVLMPLLHPKSVWNETGRWDKADSVMYKLMDVRGKDYVLSFTHEEIVLDLIRKHLKSYSDLPLALYHFSTKFRNEPRARSGILRGREFIMKDLYSAHADKKDFENYYERVKEAYLKIFERIGFETFVTESGGGVFTDNFSHEFQVVADGGEDTIYHCKKCGWAFNEEVFDAKEVKEPIDTKFKTECIKCGGEVIKDRSIEVGNIFSFGQSYCKMMNVTFTDTEGKNNFPYFGSYGIGTSRVMGAWVEVSHDQKGIIWSKATAPFAVHLIEVASDKQEVRKRTQKLYDKLLSSGIEVLWDDRQVSAGEKFNDADLIGIPYRLVVSEKTNDNEVELKERLKEEIEMIKVEDLIKRLST
ncbi:hypothetical protein JXA63_01255 [Candidatus Woesebacteria bacterium]|nr:hypothetical protein [Candidatus Woesebacteria bacterium]